MGRTRPARLIMFDRSRTAWEQPGYTVAEHTDSPPVDRNRITDVVIHYPGTDHVTDDTRTMLRNTQRYYADSRGYSIGYNYVIGTDGECWEARGLDYRSAATKGANVDTVSVQIKQAGQAPANPDQVARVRRLVADLREWAGRPLGITAHRDYAATQCPGDGITPQLRDGMFEPRPTPPTPTEDLTMRIVSPPVRVYDTRQIDDPLDAQTVRRVPVGYASGAVFVNLTVTQQTGPGYLSAWGDGPRPDVSNLNYSARDLCNTSWVPIVDGHISVWAYTGCHVIVDVQAVADS